LRILFQYAYQDKRDLQNYLNYAKILESLMAIGILLAAGNSQRFDSQVPKQLTELADRIVLEYSLSIFDDHPEISEIIIVTKEELIPIVRNIVENNYQKVSSVITGGESRQQSSLAGIDHINADKTMKIIIHDAARPFVESKMISECIDALNRYDAVTVAIPSSDTLLEVLENEVTDIPLRSNFMRAQTPQGFRFEAIQKAYELLEKANDFSPTDDCGVIQRFLPDTVIGVVEGSESNIKLTYPDDLELAQVILEQKSG